MTKRSAGAQDDGQGKQFFQLTDDEKAILTGAVCRKVCLDRLDRLSAMPRMFIEYSIQEETIEAIKQMSPIEIENQIKKIRKINLND